MFDFFGRLRRKAAEAIVLGCSDGFRAVTPEGEQVPADLSELRALLAGGTFDVKAQPSPVGQPANEMEPVGKRKAK